MALRRLMTHDDRIPFPDYGTVKIMKNRRRFMGILRRGRFTLPLMAFFILAQPASAAAYEWKASDGLAGWRVENVLSVQSTGEGLRIYGKPNNEDFLVSAPDGILRDAAYIKIRLRTLSVGAHVKCILMSKGSILLSQTNELFSGRSWKEYVFDIRGSKFRENPINYFAFVFKFNENVEIKDVIITGPSFSEFFWTQGLKALNVNLLFPFTLYGYDLNVVFLAAALASGMFIALFRAVKFKKRSLAVMCAALLVFFVILDVRESYEELAIMKTTYDDYLTAPPPEKRYYWHENLVGYTDFIRGNIDSGSGVVRFFGDADRYEYFRYLLYPIKAEMGKDSLGDANAVWESDNARIEGNTVILDGKVSTESGRGIAFSARSFLYLKNNP